MEAAGRPPVSARVRTEGSYVSARDPRLLFALGDDPGALRVTVRWPDGKREVWDDVTAGGYVSLSRGGGRAVP